MKTQKVPLRMCIACRQMVLKTELIRVVKSPTAEFTLDFTGKKDGRGAYICKSNECIEKSIKSKGLSRAFKQDIGTSIYEKLKEDYLLGTK